MKLTKFLCRAFALVLAAVSLSSAGCGKSSPQPADYSVPETTSDSLYVKKVENLSDDFIIGMDASAVPSLEASGVKYYNFAGEEEDVFKILADNGINTIRVRVWNNPFDVDGNGYGGGNCDINNALEIGKRATKYGMSLMVDFHYSDFWADPNKQMVPNAWVGMTTAEKAEALYTYTKESLQLLYDNDVAVSMVQLGNETNNGKMAGCEKFMETEQLWHKGSAAVREVYPDALIALHFANPENPDNFLSWAKKLDYYGIDYDVFASSYYPYWHGTLENLSEVLSTIATTYNKKVMVAETSYCYTLEDTDFYGNTIGTGGGVTKNYPCTVQGQANCVRDVINTIANTEGGIGVCYWEGTWISVGTTSWEENSEKWEKYGSGWASSYSKYYDPADAGLYYGGCAVDNQAFFDAYGKPLESLKVFALAGEGNTTEIVADAVEDTTIICDLNEQLVLPTQVNAVMSDDSKQAVDVTWNVTDEEIEEMHKNGAAKYTVTGTANGMTTYCYISMVEKNFVTNYSFEEDDNKSTTPTGWTVTDNCSSKVADLWVEEGSDNSVTGTKHFHFWSQASDTVNFTLEQKLENLSAGTYKYSMSISGGDGGSTNIYLYVKINGEVVYTSEKLSLNGYQQWDTEWIENIEYNGTDEIIIGISVYCSGANNGAWGKIDDALFNSVSTASTDSEE